MSCSNCLFSPGQYTDSFAHSLHLVSPRYPFCISLSMSSCFLLGMTILVPFNTRPSSMVNSSQKAQNGWILLGTSLILLGHPCCMVCFNIASVSSACGASTICCKLSLLHYEVVGIEKMMKLIYGSSYCQGPHSLFVLLSGPCLQSKQVSYLEANRLQVLLYLHLFVKQLIS